MSIQIGPYTFDRVRYDHDADVLYLSIGDPREQPTGMRRLKGTRSASTRTATWLV